MFDLDGDKVIRRNEFKKVVNEKLLREYPKRDIDKSFDFIDQDGDGKLNYLELGSAILRDEIGNKK